MEGLAGGVVGAGSDAYATWQIGRYADRELLALRRTLPRDLDVEADGRRVTMRRGDATLVADFDARTVELAR